MRDAIIFCIYVFRVFLSSYLKLEFSNWWLKVIVWVVNSSDNNTRFWKVILPPRLKTSMILLNVTAECYYRAFQACQWYKEKGKLDNLWPIVIYFYISNLWKTKERHLNYFSFVSFFNLSVVLLWKLAKFLFVFFFFLLHLHLPLLKLHCLKYICVKRI